MGHGFKNADGEVEVRWFLPEDIASVAGVVIAVLRSWGAVTVDPDF